VQTAVPRQNYIQFENAIVKMRLQMLFAVFKRELASTLKVAGEGFQKVEDGLNHSSR